MNTTPQTDSSVWPDPLPLPSAAPEGSSAHFPDQTLPGVFGELPDALAGHLQVPADAARTLTVGVLSAAAGPLRIAVGSRTEGLNLWVLVAMPAGSGKSPLVGALTRPLDQLDLQYRLQLEAAGEDCGGLARPFLLNDASPGDIIDMLAEGSGAGAVISAEGSLFDFVLRGGAGVNLDPLLQAGTNEAIRYSRRGPLRVIASPALTLVVCPQPQILDRLQANGRLKERGFLDRVIAVEPPVAFGARDLTVAAPDDALVQAYNTAVLDLHQMCAKAKGAALQMSRDAGALYDAYRGRIEAQRGPTGALGGEVRGWALKNEGRLLRLAGVLHLAKHGPAGLGRVVVSSTVNDAVAVIEFFTAEAKALRSRRALPGTALLPKVAGFLEQLGHRSFYQRDLCRKFSATAEEIETVLEQLADLHHVRRAQARSRPGRPPVIWSINPRLAA